MRAILLKIHLYAGLLCSSYLVIFGISSLNFNHHFGKPAALKSERQRSLDTLPAIADDQRLAEALRDTLGLGGYTLTWETDRSETEDSLYFRFVVWRPGKEFRVRVQSPKELGAVPEEEAPSPPVPPKKGETQAGGRKESPPNAPPPKEQPKVAILPLREPVHLVFIEETDTGLWPIIGALHGFSGNMPGAGFMRFWAIYTEVCVWVVFFSMVSGVCLWTAKPSERLVGLILLGAGAGGGLLFMLYIWIWG
ncbi:MAG: hypothetical protein HYW07_22430 [Candidatus Latescibacteria bacterium]|nr:hypothetical protein [Candidatus Latescibacterota bacterium]